MPETAERTRRSRAVPLPSLSTLWKVLVPLLLFSAVGRVLILPNDFWWHIRVGAIIWHEHTIPRHDLFSFTRYGAPWTYQAWLAEVLLYLAYAGGGAALVILVHALTVTLGYTIPLRDLARRLGPRPAALATLYAAGISMWNWNVRPQTFTFLLFGILLVLIERHRARGGAILWWTLPLFALWGNLHGGFVFGLAYLWTYIAAVLIRQSLAARRVRLLPSLLAPGVAATLAVGLTPWGPMGMVRYVLGFLQSKVTVQLNPEFSPLTLRHPDGKLFFASLIILLLVHVITGYRPRLDQGLPLLAFALAALWAHRAISWYGFVLIPVLAEALHVAWPGRPSEQPSLLSGAIVLILLVNAFLMLPWWRGALPTPLFPDGYLAPTTPVQATAYLCRNVGENARVYQNQVFASYQIWACPRLKVFIDTRLELYPTALWDDYLAVEQARFDWEEILRRYRITHLFLSTFYQPHTIRAARASSCWEEIYADEVAVIFASRCSDEAGRKTRGM